jgi:hypothetical protein
VTYRDLLGVSLSTNDRHAWHRRALDVLAGVDVVFADPDNGMRTTAGRSKLHKFSLLEELADYASRGQSLVVYQHSGRLLPVAIRAQHRLAENRRMVSVSALSGR